MPTFLQQQYPYHFQPPAPTKLFTPVVIVLLILLIAGSVLLYWFKEDFIYYFGLTGFEVMGWKIWQCFTYSFIEPSWWNLLVDTSILIFCGSAVEREYKSRNLVVFFALTIPIFGLIMLVVMMLFRQIQFIIGSDVLYYGTLGMFAYCYRKQRFMLYIWAVEADKIAWVLVIIGAVFAIFRPYYLLFVPASFLGWYYIKWFKGGGIRIGGRTAKTASRPAGERKGGFVDVD